MVVAAVRAGSVAGVHPRAWQVTDEVEPPRGRWRRPATDASARLQLRPRLQIRLGARSPGTYALCTAWPHAALRSHGRPRGRHSGWRPPARSTPSISADMTARARSLTCRALDEIETGSTITACVGRRDDYALRSSQRAVVGEPPAGARQPVASPLDAVDVAVLHVDRELAGHQRRRGRLAVGRVGPEVGEQQSGAGGRGMRGSGGAADRFVLG